MALKLRVTNKRLIDSPRNGLPDLIEVTAEVYNDTTNNVVWGPTTRVFAKGISRVTALRTFVDEARYERESAQIVDTLPVGTEIDAT